MTVFETLESEVRSYSRVWPVVFDRAEGSRLYSEEGTAYLDFFAGAGALNYGHANPALKKVLLDYIIGNGVAHALDMFTVAKRDFLQTFDDLILKPRELDYKVVFPGPGGANAIEAALKLARTVTGRSLIVSFTNSFHGMTLGALAISGNTAKREAAGIPLVNAITVPYDGYSGCAEPRPRHLEAMLSDRGSGMDRPAAVVVETVQGEGGLGAARVEWLRALADLCRRHGVLLVVDDVQMGCGRTGPFFSFEDAGIVPDMVCLSKSIGGYGLPLALTLIRRELDVWQPGAHNGTFRGVSSAFVTGAQALRCYWSDDVLENTTRAKGDRIASALKEIATDHPGADLQVRGRGLAAGLRFPIPGTAGKVCAAAFDGGLLVETSGSDEDVVKLLPPLTVSDTEIDEGLDIIRTSVNAVLTQDKEIL
ncbi:diaminobutyrate--2-oxoglutarate transaminase [Pseudonocardia xinjiangensis]|uniref:diaminobutyrate--2-oxoglutarate transaminase n=1 Tax=Pseudonocardia xinjiangensis TaxID=75289 RepID=UPI003D93CAE4